MFTYLSSLDTIARARDPRDLIYRQSFSILYISRREFFLGDTTGASVALRLAYEKSGCSRTQAYLRDIVGWYFDVPLPSLRSLRIAIQA
ncbi:hypothetical protein [Phyllobacterium sp. 22552]|uniref:hypothetical protein n=1 Tax=Phyllobacterium sp. 22552 TaxID=3453941 RepID=UPI003F878CD1